MRDVSNVVKYLRSKSGRLGSRKDANERGQDDLSQSKYLLSQELFADEVVLLIDSADQLKCLEGM